MGLPYGEISRMPHTGRGFWIGRDWPRAMERILSNECTYCNAPPGSPCKSYPPELKAAGTPPPYPAADDAAEIE